MEKVKYTILLRYKINKSWSDEAWNNYFYWQKQDKKILKKINDIIKDIDCNHMLELENLNH